MNTLTTHINIYFIIGGIPSLNQTQGIAVSNSDSIFVDILLIVLPVPHV